MNNLSYHNPLPLLINDLFNEIKQGTNLKKVATPVIKTHFNEVKVVPPPGAFIKPVIRTTTHKKHKMAGLAGQFRSQNLVLMAANRMKKNITASHGDGKSTPTRKMGRSPMASFSRSRRNSRSISEEQQPISTENPFEGVTKSLISRARNSVTRQENEKIHLSAPGISAADAFLEEIASRKMLRKVNKTGPQRTAAVIDLNDLNDCDAVDVVFEDYSKSSTASKEIYKSRSKSIQSHDIKIAEEMEVLEASNAEAASLIELMNGILDQAK